jgi:MFS family permease
LIGSWLTRVATSWLVYRLSKSALILGVVSFAGQVPTFILAPVAGVLVDRWSRHRVLVVTQVLAMVQSALLAAFTLSGKITVTDVLLLSAFQGLINAFDMPARQAFVVEMIHDRADLPNAIALNSSMVNVARLVGPSCAGILIAAFGEGGCFTIDAVSYLAVIASLLLMRLQKEKSSTRSQKRMSKELSEGFKYAVAFKPIQNVLMILALVSLMGMPYMVLLPMVVTERLQGGAALLGYLTAVSGVGALCGVLYLASRKSVLGLGRIVSMASLAFGIGLMGFSWSRWPAVSMVFIFFTGMGMMVLMASGNTILQTIVEEDKRGRVMSLYTMAVAGMVPFGSLFSGLVAKAVGAPITILIGGVACSIGGLWFLSVLPSIREQVRPIYQRLGIIPEIATGLQQADRFARPPED